MEPNKTALNGRSTRESLHKAALPQGTAYSTAYIMDSPAAPVLKPVKTPNGPNMQQMMSQTLNQIKKLTMACLVLGIITVTETP